MSASRGLLAYGFTSACFDDYTDSVRTATGYAPVSYKDNHVPFVPQHTLAATADYKILVDPAALLDPTHRLHLRDVTVGLNLAAQGTDLLGRGQHHQPKLLRHPWAPTPRAISAR